MREANAHLIRLLLLQPYHFVAVQDNIPTSDPTLGDASRQIVKTDHEQFTESKQQELTSNPHSLCSA